MATIVHGKRRIPYMRGMLIHYLIQRGFGQDEASELANATRAALSKTKTIRGKEIVQLIRDLIAERAVELDPGDLVFWERMPTSVTVESGGAERPFSKEILAHSIQVTGLPPDAAYEIAGTLESRLIDQRRKRITRAELADVVAAHLEQEHDHEYSARYRLWRRWTNLDLPLVILLGGATGVGKTTLAIALAALLDIPRVVATDDIRQIMRLMLSTELMPALHPSSYAAGEALPESPIAETDPLITGFREQARVVAVGVRAIISRCIEENTSVIIDGVHLLPELLNLQEAGDLVCFAPLTLSLSDRKAYAARFAERGKRAPERPPHKYLQHLDDILKVQEFILENSMAHDIPLLDTGSTEDLTSSATVVIGEHLARHPAMGIENPGEEPGTKKRRPR